MPLSPKWEYLTVELGTHGLNDTTPSVQFINRQEVSNWKNIPLHYAGLASKCAHTS
jgi:hypothetical protein